MKKALLLLALSSPSAMAIVGGESLDWHNQFSNMTTMDCTGTIIGGKFLLTAGHCWGAASVSFSGNRDTNQDDINVLEHHLPPDDGTNQFSPDIAVWELERAHLTKDIRFVADLNHDPIRVGDQVTMYGFGGSDLLKKGVSQIADTSGEPHDLSFLYVSNDIGQGVLQGGDSGGPWVNTEGDIIGVSRTVGNDNSMTATRLAPIKDWLSQTVNAWHYPTLANVSGRKTIKIQSLHQNNVDLLNKLHFFGDVDVDTASGTCVTDRTISPFEICTLEVTSNGGEGTIVLADGQEIQINKPTPVEPPTPPTPPSAGGGSSGGSMGLFGLLGLFGLGVMRSRKR